MYLGEDHLAGKKKLRHVLLPSLGFGLGGLIAGYSGDFLFLGFAVMGLLGGGALAYSLGLSKLSVIKAALYGGGGFFLGFYITFFVVLNLWEPPISLLFAGFFWGGVGGIMLALSFKSKIAVLKLGLGGAIGFGCGMLFVEFFRMPIMFAVAGIIGGAAIGFTLQTLRIKK